MLILGSIIAWLTLIFGALRVGIGYYVASIDDPASRAAAASRYLLSGSSGQAIDQGVKVFLFGLALGILVKIASSLVKIARSLAERKK
ncbi:MAG: hypothetical protein Q7J44_14810 [Pseudotabrizicola sp.]|uniref:hypothetical protein n=1 Tax=Pseudotabrizicola sp. TaxID=2939647 RepID=UPI002719FBC9|nr:hypothetical protein [Pseudotabrizicola sp.]MDO9639807.1 hypothetical protein [Pseudotabrizicola sp.]